VLAKCISFIIIITIYIYLGLFFVLFFSHVPGEVILSVVVGDLFVTVQSLLLIF
jgi:hypothetical protein